MQGSDRLLTVGDCVSFAVRYCRRDIAFLAKKLMVPSIIELVGKLCLVWGARLYLEAQKSSGHAVLPSGASLGLMAIGVLVAFPAELWLTIIQLAYVRTIVLKCTYEEAIKQVKGRVGSIIVYALLLYVGFLIWVFVWAFLFALGGFFAKLSTASAIIMIPILLLMMVIALVSLLVIMLPLCLIFAILACEDTGFWRVFAKSFTMTFNRLWPTVCFAIVAFATITGIYMALTSVLQVVYSVFYFQSGVYTGKALASDVRVPLYIQMFGSCWHSLVYMYTMPVTYLTSGIYYYSLRMREEGIDLSQSLDRLQSKLKPETSGS